MGLLKQKTEEEHQRAWNGLQTCRQAKEFLVGCRRINTEYLLELDKKSLGVMIRVLTVPNSLRYHLNKMGFNDDPHCNAETYPKRQGTFIVRRSMGLGRSG